MGIAAEAFKAFFAFAHKRDSLSPKILGCFAPKNGGGKAPTPLPKIRNSEFRNKKTKS